MCFISELTTILLFLLTFILTTTMPTITTTTTTTTRATLSKSMVVTAAAVTATSSTAPITNHKRIQQQQQQQQNEMSSNNNELLMQQSDSQSSSPSQSRSLHTDDFNLLADAPVSDSASGSASVSASASASAVEAAINDNINLHMHGRGLSHNHGHAHAHTHAHNQVHVLNMDYNGIDAPAVDGVADEEDTTYPPPLFDFGVARNITARSGQTAAITCRVDNLSDKMVAWIRKRDLHILTVGMVTYSSDERFEVKHVANSKDWTLQVKYAQPRDTGIYECQVNTEPKISMAFRLNVIVTPPDAKAIIAGPSDLYVKVGSAITLTCHVKQPTLPSGGQDIGPIYWYRGPYILTPFVAHPNEAAIDLQRISMESKLGEKLQSRLRIANAQTNDSGNYTCMPTTADAASVLVNVINDESPAAMQKSGATSLLDRQIRCGVNFSATLAFVVVSVASMTAYRWFEQQQEQRERHQLVVSNAKHVERQTCVIIGFALAAVVVVVVAVVHITPSHVISVATSAALTLLVNVNANAVS